MPTYRVHDHKGDDLGAPRAPAPNVDPGPLVAPLEVIVAGAPHTG